MPVWVCGEVADLKINASGHCYIELIEKNEKTGATEAQARATIWRSQVMSTVGRFEQETGQRLAKGMKILFKATVSHHAVYGMSLQIQQIDALHTLGDMERRKQEAIARLPQKQRLVFNMKYYEEMKYEEISAILDTSVGALKASYHIAVKKIEEYLSKAD